MLESARRVVASDGVVGLNIRAVAAGVGASTMAVYTHFGGRGQLLDALFFDALERLGAAMRATRGIADPIARIMALAATFRQFALANRGSFLVVMHKVGEPKYARAIRDAPPYVELVATVEEVKRKGVTSAAVDVMADSLWAATQGAVSLELAGYYASKEEADARFAELGRIILAGLRANVAS